MLAVTIYTTGPSCGKCTMTKNMLTGKGIAWEEINVTENPAAYTYITEDLGYSMAPVVVVEDGTGQDHWCDLRPDHIDRIAKQNHTD